MKKHILVILAQNNPGVLHRVTSLIRQRQFNIESLAAGYTENKGVSHMTIVINVEKTSIEQVAKQMYKLIDVTKVTDCPYEDSLKRELALIKIKCNKKSRPQLIQMAQTFAAKVSDMSHKEVVFELSAPPEKIDTFVEIAKEYGLQEVKRTGVIALNSVSKK